MNAAHSLHARKGGMPSITMAIETIRLSSDTMIFAGMRLTASSSVRTKHNTEPLSNLQKSGADSYT